MPTAHNAHLLLNGTIGNFGSAPEDEENFSVWTNFLVELRKSESLLRKSMIEFDYSFSDQWLEIAQMLLDLIEPGNEKPSMTIDQFPIWNVEYDAATAEFLNSSGCSISIWFALEKAVDYLGVGLVDLGLTKKKYAEIAKIYEKLALLMNDQKDYFEAAKFYYIAGNSHNQTAAENCLKTAILCNCSDLGYLAKMKQYATELLDKPSAWNLGVGYLAKRLIANFQKQNHPVDPTHDAHNRRASAVEKDDEVDFLIRRVIPSDQFAHKTAACISSFESAIDPHCTESYAGLPRRDEGDKNFFDYPVIDVQLDPSLSLFEEDKLSQGGCARSGYPGIFPRVKADYYALDDVAKVQLNEDTKTLTMR